MSTKQDSKTETVVALVSVAQKIDLRKTIRHTVANEVSFMSLAQSEGK